MDNSQIQSEYQLLEKFKHKIKKEGMKKSKSFQTISQDNPSMKRIKSTTSLRNMCPHENTIEEGEIKICEDCGLEINGNLYFDKYWKFYGLPSDGRKILDSNRCFKRKEEERNILKDVDGLGFSEKIIARANILYNKVTKGKIYRGDFRKAIIFACIFHVYKEIDNPISFDKLRTCFNIDRTIILKGMKKVNPIVSKMEGIRGKYITPIEIINEIMDSLNATEIQKQNVINLYEKIRNKSEMINRSRPQSVASGVIYHYIKEEGKKINLKEFVQKVKLSEMTIIKINKEIDNILKKKELKVIKG